MQLFFPQTLRRFVYRAPRERGMLGTEEGPRGGGKRPVGVGKRRAALAKEEHAENSAGRLEGNIYEDGDWEMGLGQFPVILGPVRSFGLSVPAEGCRGDLAWLPIQLGAWICAELKPVVMIMPPRGSRSLFKPCMKYLKGFCARSL